MSKRERYIRRGIFFAVIIVAVLLLCGSLCRGKHDVFEDAQIVSYYIEPGDKLWLIAREYKLDNMSFDDYIRRVQKHNGISSNIKWGDTIQIFVWED